MSTNTTSTSNGAGPTGTSGRKYRFPFATIPLPDAAMLERMANEFFLVMPQDLADGEGAAATAAPPEPEAEEIPVFSFQDMPGVESPPSMPASPPPPAPGPLTESDLRAIAASLEGATAFAPGAPGTVPSAPVSGAPPDLFAEGKVSPIAQVPVLPPP